MRFRSRARSRRPNPGPASLIAPVVSSSASGSRESILDVPPPLWHFAAGRNPARERFSTAHVRGTFAPFKSRRALWRVKEDAVDFFTDLATRRSVRENASCAGGVARARLHTKTRATHGRARRDISLQHSSSLLLADMSAGETFARESSRRRRDPARTTGRLSSSTRLAAAHALRAFLVAAAAVSTGAQSLSAQGGMYYPYGSAVGPLYGYARRTAWRRGARREPSSRPTRDVSSDAPLLSETRNANPCLLYTSPSPRDKRQSRMPSSA